MYVVMFLSCTILQIFTRLRNFYQTANASGPAQRFWDNIELRGRLIIGRT